MAFFWSQAKWFLTGFLSKSLGGILTKCRAWDKEGTMGGRWGGGTPSTRPSLPGFLWPLPQGGGAVLDAAGPHAPRPPLPCPGQGFGGGRVDWPAQRDRGSESDWRVKGLASSHTNVAILLCVSLFLEARHRGPLLVPAQPCWSFGLPGPWQYTTPELQQGPIQKTRNRRKIFKRDEKW